MRIKNAEPTDRRRRFKLSLRVSLVLILIAGGLAGMTTSQVPSPGWGGRM
jgi:hypothetical protein